MGGSFSRFKYRVRTGFRTLGAVLAVLILVHVAHIVTGGCFAGWGIQPRNPQSLLHIFTSPFLHGSSYHLANNLLGMAIFGSLCLVRGVPFFYRSSLFIIVVSGLLVWLFGRGGLHIGASGWIFGLWSLAIAMAVFQRRVLDIVIAVGVVLLYGGMIFGVLPGRPNISFEAHLFGALAGVFYAYLNRKPATRS